MTSPEQPESRTWYARICCPVCYGPVRVRLWESEGRCRGCRPKRKHSTPQKSPRTDLDALIAQHRQSTR